MELSKYLSMVHLSERNLADAFVMVSDRHDRDAEIKNQCRQLAEWSRAHVSGVEPFLEKYGEDESKNESVHMLRGALFHGTRVGALGTLADMQDLLLLANSVLSQWTTVNQAALTLDDKELMTFSEKSCEETDRQISWLKTQVKTHAPQAITVPAVKSSELIASMPKRETASTIQDVAWAPIAAGVLMLVGGAIAMLAGLAAGLGSGYPWLFPSLGPTAYLQAESPAHPAARFYNTVVGHAVGVAAGFVAVFAVGAYYDPVVLSSHHLTWGRVIAAALALALTLLVALLLKASHPPAGATTLLVALGAFKLEDVPAIVAGVLIVAVAGEFARRMRLGQITFRREERAERLPAPKPKPQG